MTKDTANIAMRPSLFMLALTYHVMSGTGNLRLPSKYRTGSIAAIILEDAQLKRKLCGSIRDMRATEANQSRGTCTPTSPISFLNPRATTASYTSDLNAILFPIRFLMYNLMCPIICLTNETSMIWLVRRCHTSPWFALFSSHHNQEHKYLGTVVSYWRGWNTSIGGAYLFPLLSLRWFPR